MGHEERRIHQGRNDGMAEAGRNAGKKTFHKNFSPIVWTNIRGIKRIHSTIFAITCV
jgi:hypothetical protein